MSEDQSQPSSIRRYVPIAVKITVSGALLAFLFSRIDAGRLWAGARHASLRWLAVALLLYLANVAGAIWRWNLLLNAQDVQIKRRTLLGSMLVALFFNNFLPSNIGGDVIRIRDSARSAGSKTLATTVILVDRGIGLMGLVLVAAFGATMAAGAAGHGPVPIWPSWLWAGFLIAAATATPVLLAPAGLGRLLQPLTALHPEWIGARIEKLTMVLGRFRDRPGVLVSCFGAAVFVQILSVVFYLAVAYALGVNITPWDMAVIVPISFVVQMIPLSVNGLGIREATFSVYFTRIGLPIESALLVSLVATGLIMLFSLGGAAVYISRSHH